MIRYFFKLTFRNIRKYKVNTVISLLGLTVGLASFILISSYIRHELSFNKFNENYKRIYVAKINFNTQNGIEQGIHMPYPLVEGLTSAFPDVELGVRFSPIYSQLANGDKSFFEDNASYADNSFFKIFTVKFLGGDDVNPLNEPYTIVLTKKTANKYFADENPIGKSLLLEGRHTLKVTAIIDDFPVNSDFRYNFLVSMKTRLAMNSSRDYSQAWYNFSFNTLFLLDKNCDYKKLNEKLESFLDAREYDFKPKLFLSPLSMHHLKPNKDDNSIKLLIIFGLIAIFILIIACINFINLSIANAANRIKETSIRRIVGSKKSSLILQQLGESVLLSFISFDLAYLLAERLLQNFNAILHTQIPLNSLFNIPYIISMLATAIVLGVVSGAFPAIKIGRIQPLDVLSGKKTGINRIGFGKKGLVVVQYAVSVVLIISTIAVYQQSNYLKNKELGFEKDCLLTAYVGNENNEINLKLKSFKDEISRYAGVQNIALSRHLPFYGNSGSSIRKENASKEDPILVDYNMVESSFFDTYGIAILSKRELSEHTLSQEAKYCYINQTAAKMLGFENPVGEKIYMDNVKCEIVGVYKDFHIYSLQNKIPAQVLILAGDANTYKRYGWMAVKCNEQNLDKVKALASKTLKEFLPDNPYSFFNYGEHDFKGDSLNKVQGIERTFGFFSLIAILIACMGIFGLVALTVKQKTKEIGIRKVLGSSVSEIFKLIAREYIILAVIGNIIAWLPAWLVVNKILQDFAYRIDISLLVFVYGLIISIVLTMASIAFHSIKAARANPVESIKWE